MKNFAWFGIDYKYEISKVLRGFKPSITLYKENFELKSFDVVR